MAETGAKFEVFIQGFTPAEYERRAQVLAAEYWKNATDRTEKSEGGGNLKGYTDIIKCGKGATLILRSLQARDDYWQAYHDRIDPAETSAERAIRHALANRYLKQRKANKHFGRPARTVDGIVIRGLTGGAPLESYFSTMARYFLEYGERVLTDEFLDAVLDNGGLRPNEREPSSSLRELIENCHEIIEADCLPRDELSLVKKALEILEGRS